jgi:3',5'-cyclic AMP phosphodiesterase CpdA
MDAAQLVEELHARLSLTAGTHTVLLLVGKDQRDVAASREPLQALLRAAGPFQVEELGTAHAKLGPVGWVERMQGRTADVFTLVVEPGERFAVRSFGRRLNGEREHLRRLPGPLVLLMSEADEGVLRQVAPDFFTWIAQVYALPPTGEIQGYARRTLGDLAGTAAAVAGASGTLSPSSPPIRFLHLSDIHFKTGAAKTYDRSRVLQGLLERLRKDRNQSQLDLVFFTGDLAFAGASEEYLVAVEFLGKLLEVTGIDRERLFVVPGNHDADRKIGRWALRTLRSDDDATDFFVDEQCRRLHEQKFAAYRAALAPVLGEARPLGLKVGGDAVEVIEVRGVKLAVASFNSAWFAVDDADIEKLWLGQASVDLAAQRIEAEEDVAIAIALMHHPTEYLAQLERSSVEKRLERSFDLVLRGHLHRDKAVSVLTPRGGYVELAAPAAYQGSQWPNGCFIGELSTAPRAMRVRAYKFGDGADPWTLDASVFPDDDNGHVFALRERRRRGAIAGTFNTAITGSIIGAMSVGDRATAFGNVRLEQVQPKEAVAALESSGGRLPDNVRKTLVERLALQIPLPPEPPVPWGPEAFEGMLRRLLDYWAAHRDEWLEELGNTETTYALVTDAFFKRQAGQRLDYQVPFGSFRADVVIGIGRDRAILEIRGREQAQVDRALAQITNVTDVEPARMGAVLWFWPDRPRQDQHVGVYFRHGDRTIWLVAL